MEKHISILEDNDDLRELYSYILADEGYILHTFATVSSFNAQTDFIPDLYLLDVMLPDGDGIIICQKLKNDPETAQIPVILVSAHQDLIEVKRLCPEADFIPKPFDINHLIEAIALRISA